MSDRPSVKDRAAAYIAKMDAAIEGAGGDRQTFHVACKLVEFGLSSSDAFRLLSEYNNRCEPKWTEEALSRKLKCAFARAAPNPDFVDKDEIAERGSLPEIKSESPWPKTNFQLRNKICLEGCGLADLCDLSPVQFQMPPSLEILNLIFPGNPLVCVGRSSTDFWTRSLCEFKRAHLMQFVVPSPMSKLLGKIQDPRSDGPFESAHTKDNTGPRKFAVVEFDSGDSDEHAALLYHLSQFAPLVMAVHSGGKSLHGWFDVAGCDEVKVRKFYRYAVWLGADRATFLKSQFVRMPGGRRANGNLQPVYYFNPEIIK